jgi:hypothetical protein
MALLLLLPLAILFYIAINQYRYHVGSLLLFPFFLHFGLNIFGVLNLYLIDNTTTTGIYIPEKTINQVTFEFFCANIFIMVAFFILMKLIGKRTFHGDVLDYFKSTRAKSLNKKLIAATFFLLLFDSFYYGTPPGLLALSGNISDSALQKGLILETKMQSAVPVLGYYVRYLPIIAFVHALLFYQFNSSSFKQIFSLCMAFFLYSLLTLIKSYLFLPLLFLLWSFFCFGGLRISHIFRMLIVIVPTLALTFSALSTQFSKIFSAIVSRIFLVQAEGMFVIRGFYDEIHLGAIFFSSPLRHFFSIETFDPAAAIVRHYFGDGNGWVNMNSFYSGQGYVMFGYSYLAIIPVLFVLQFLLTRTLLRSLVDNGLANVILISIGILLPLSNNIANLIWFKDFYSVIMLIPFLLIITYRSKRVIK